MGVVGQNNRNGFKDDPDIGISKPKLQSNYYKYVQELKEVALISERYFNRQIKTLKQKPSENTRTVKYNI